MCLWHCHCHLWCHPFSNPTTSIPNSSLLVLVRPSSSQKPTPGDISGTKRAIIEDPLVSKRLEKILKQFCKKIQKISKCQRPISVKTLKLWGRMGFSKIEWKFDDRKVLTFCVSALTKCLKGHRSLGSLFYVKICSKIKKWLTEWVTQSVSDKVTYWAVHRLCLDS